MKTLKDKFEDIVKEVRNVHSYIIPEIIAIPLTEGNRDYPQWAKGEVENGENRQKYKINFISK